MHGQFNKSSLLAVLRGFKIHLQFSKDFIENYNEGRDLGYFLKIDVHYFEKLHDLYNHLLFLPERMKSEIVEKLFTNLYNKKEYVKHNQTIIQQIFFQIIY